MDRKKEKKRKPMASSLFYQNRNGKYIKIVACAILKFHLNQHTYIHTQILEIHSSIKVGGFGWFLYCASDVSMMSTTTMYKDLPFLSHHVLISSDDGR